MTLPPTSPYDDPELDALYRVALRAVKAERRAIERARQATATRAAAANALAEAHLAKHDKENPR